MELDKLKLHFIYVVGILVFVMILIATGLWTDKVNFTEFLANAATMISIVLGLIAIFYSFISNSSLSQSLGNISKVSEEVVQVKGQIEEFLKHASDLEISGKENAHSLKEISASVESHVETLRSALDEVTEKTQLLQEAVGVLPEKFDKLENRFFEFSNDSNSKAKAKDADNVTNDANRIQAAKYFLNCSSYIGRLTVYACVLAQTSNKELSITDYSKQVATSPLYVQGYLVAMVAAGFVDKINVGGKDRNFKITRIDETIRNEAKNIMIEILNKKYKDRPEFIEQQLDRIKGLESYFESL